MTAEQFKMVVLNRTFTAGGGRNQSKSQSLTDLSNGIDIFDRPSPQYASIPRTRK